MYVDLMDDFTSFQYVICYTSNPAPVKHVTDFFF